MTSFTGCYQDILYTLRPMRAWKKRPSEEGEDGLGNRER